jgi:DNA-binding MarR family transcriptional regulator
VHCTSRGSLPGRALASRWWVVIEVWDHDGRRRVGYRRRMRLPDSSRQPGSAVDGDSASTASLLIRIGAYSATKLTEMLSQLDLTPAQTGLLRAVALEPGRSQQAIAAQLGMQPSRLVTLVDQLEERGLVRRDRNRDDRRTYSVTVTVAGSRMMGRIRELSRTHEDTLLADLDADERKQLHALLSRLAAAEDVLSVHSSQPITFASGGIS